MSRVAKAPVNIPKNVEVLIENNLVTVKGPKGSLTKVFSKLVSIEKDGSQSQQLIFKPASEHPNGWMQAGTARSVVNGMVQGVSDGFTKTLELVGVGYRAQAKEGMLALSLGFSHPIEYQYSKDVQIETPNNTTIIIKGTDKQKVGQVAAVIRSRRPPEPYKGKGIRYSGEQIARKDAKKK